MAIDMEGVKARIDRAHKLIGDLCMGRQKWKMSIPADEERDSDLILSAALTDADRLIVRIEDLERGLRLLRQHTAGCDRCQQVADHDSDKATANR